MNRLRVVLALGWIVLFQHFNAHAALRLEYLFREPAPESYSVELGPFGILPTQLNSDWIEAQRTGKPGQTVWLGKRLILIPAAGVRPETLLLGRPLQNLRLVHSGIWAVDAPDAWIAAEEAVALSALPTVEACYPGMRYDYRLQDGYSKAAADPYFPQQWHLENRNTEGTRQGTDVNVRAGWSTTQGENMLIAVVDDGVEMTHPDLLSRFAGNPHFNFGDQTTNAGPSLPTASHSTAVAGLIAASKDNGRGVTGVAPAARMASWVIFKGTSLAVDALAMKQMFEAYSNVVQIQNHSWAAGGTALYPLPPLSDIGISNAVTFGRQGRGVVMVRAASNFRANQADANADGFASDPRIVTVAAVRSDGRAARYSNPGSCVLVAAPSGETDANTGATDLLFPTLVTTDLTGINGKNQILGADDSADYRFGFSGFSGTSGATPIVSGIVALMLSVNPTLTVRDVQQVLILSSRHADLADPAVITNGAGLRVSYNVGYGIPDAGTAVARARAWHNRPAPQRVTRSFSTTTVIPDDGYRVEVTGNNIPPALQSIPVTSALGPHPDEPTSFLPLLSIGGAGSALALNLNNSVGLCLRGGNSFADKIQKAADAGASWVIIYNNQGTTERTAMMNTDFVPIPAVFMGKTSGDGLEQLLTTNTTAKARLRALKASFTFTVTNTLLCEHVALRLRTDHTRRGDLRISLFSPAGTRSILQRVSTDSLAGPSDWTYYTVQNFFESSAGVWRVEVIDEEAGNTGKVLGADLTVTGVPIVDTDADGLDDGWEISHFGSLAPRASDDPDHDGLTNAAEQLLQTDPLVTDIDFRLDVTPWNATRLRLSWPGLEGVSYRILGAASAEGPYLELQTIPGRFPVTDWVMPVGQAETRLLRVEQLSP